MLAVLFAGIVYHFTTILSDAHGSQSTSGRVYADQAQYRLELPKSAAQPFDVVISRDADRTAVMLNSEKQTYHDRVRVSPKTRSSILMQFPFPGGKVIDTPSVAHRQDGRGTIAGHPATKHVIELRYRIESTDPDTPPVNATVTVLQVLWTADDLPRLPFERALTTGWPEVDKPLGDVTSALTGMTLQSELLVQRTFDGGVPIRESTRTVLDELRVENVPRTMFEIPHGFKYDEKPVAPRLR
jgi:hypothetical protein